MIKRVLNQVVDYLTIVTEDRIYQILPIEVLLRQHTLESVVNSGHQIDHAASRCS